MAEMETVITSPEFVKSLEKNRSALNAFYEYYNSAESRIDSADIFSVFAKILSPLYDCGMTVSDNVLLSVFKCILKLISKRMVGEKARNREFEHHFFAIAEKYKNLLAGNGGVFLINIINPLMNLYAKKNFPVARWVSIVLSFPENTGLDEFKRYGFIAAWICGSAVAGESAAEMVRTLSPEITRILFGIDASGAAAHSNIADAVIKNRWRNPAADDKDDSGSSPVFRTAGGFCGFGNEFSALPSVVSIDENFYASDGHEVFRLYADCYGTELIRDHGVDPDMIRPGGVINRFVKDRNFLFDNKSWPLPPEWKNGVSTIAFNRNTVVWTLKDSYKLYIAGIRSAYV